MSRFVEKRWGVKRRISEAKYCASYTWLLGNLNRNETAKKVFNRALELAPHRENIKNIYGKFKVLADESILREDKIQYLHK